MLDLSAFAIALVIGWALLFRRWPSANAQWHKRPMVIGLWLGWGVVAVSLAAASGTGWPLITAGVAAGAYGHAMLLFWAQQGKDA